MEDPTDEELRRFDRKRKKKTSNKDWQSATDPDSRVTKMKDGRTHLAYKAEHAVDVESEMVVAAVIYRADDADPETLPVTIELAREQLAAADSPQQVEEVVADKGYHKARDAADGRRRCKGFAPTSRSRSTRPPAVAGQAGGAAGDRVREPATVRGQRGRRLGRWRSERVERSFAHMCARRAADGARGCAGCVNVSKSYLGRAAAHNLGIIMLALFGIGTARSLQGGMGLLFAIALVLCWLHLCRGRLFLPLTRLQRLPTPGASSPGFALSTATSSTGC